MKINKLSGNALKIIALICMTFDHVGEELLNNYQPFRIIGRLSFPLFAYMIAEGCRYTKNRKKHFLMIFLLGTGCQIVFSVAEKSLYMGILITFSLSVLLIYALQYASAKKSAAAWLVPAGGLLAAVFLCEILPRLLPSTDYQIDYGIFGVLLPVFVYLAGENKYRKIVFIAAGLVLLALDMGGIQWYSLICLALLFLYSGERGRLNLKYLFYIYYPLHLIIIYMIKQIVIKQVV